MKDSVKLGAKASAALDGLVCYVGQVNVSLENMAWLWFVARSLPDTEQYFPRGKWATIQHIQGQLCELAEAKAEEVVRAGQGEG